MLKQAAAGVYRLESELTFATVADLRSQGMVALAAAGSTGSVIFDLDAVRQVDSAGLALLVDWLAAARAAGARLCFTGLSSGLRALARLSDVEDLLVAAG
ncbi:MAG: STAS domain-containing protein [Gammaproteobacteria bacterium]|nr:STAS domain-containing protein [Gammaproteobacteria bacterium]